jgi:hypothetical protein
MGGRELPYSVFDHRLSQIRLADIVNNKLMIGALKWCCRI